MHRWMTGMVALIAVMMMAMPVPAQTNDTAQAAVQMSPDSVLADTALSASASDGALQDMGADEAPSFHQMLKTKFIEGNAGFMSLVALALVLGLAFCIERIIYLSLSEIDAKRLMSQIADHVGRGDIDGAVQQCAATRGPVAALCREGLQRSHESMANIERTLVAYGNVQAAKLEQG